MATLTPNAFHVCPYCLLDFSERGGRTIDHIVPRSRGGSNRTENLVTCCWTCNNNKGDMLVTEWYGWLLADNDRRVRVVFAALKEAAGDDLAVWRRIAIESAAGVRRYRAGRWRSMSWRQSNGVPSWVPASAVAAWEILNATKSEGTT